MPNKTPVFRILILFTLFSLNLAACNATPALTLTATLPVETPKPSATATESSTATETPDPNKPDGATNKINGEWVRIVNGVTYHKHEEAGDGWFTSAILESPPELPEGVWLNDPEEYDPYSLFVFYMFSDEKVQGFPKIRRLHQETPADVGKYLGSAIYNILYSSRFEKTMTRLEFYYALTNPSDGISVPFTTPDGIDYIWKVGGGASTSNQIKKSIRVFAIPWADADPSTNSEFRETPERAQFGDAVYRWAVLVSSDGFLVIKVSAKDPASLTDDEYLAMFLNPLETVIRNPIIPSQDKGWKVGDMSDFVMASTKRPSHPFFEIVR